MVDLSQVCVLPKQTLREVMQCIDRNTKGIGLVVDNTGRLLYTITDGDLRRAMLHGLNIDMTVEAWANTMAEHGSRHPLTAPFGTPSNELLQLMQSLKIRHIPLIDTDGIIVDLVALDDLLVEQPLAVSAVIMAGGMGTRLRPLTEDLPKPMLPVGGRPLMERILVQLQQAGIRQVIVTTHYKSEKIIEYFGDGREFGITLNYVNEGKPLGTGGALGLMPRPSNPILVMNGDILTQVDIRSLFAYHQEHHAEMTVAVRRYEVQVPYGVVECEGANVRQLREKPQIGFLVNAGIYLIEPSVYDLIPNGKHFNMTDLIQWLLDAGRTVISFPIREYWLDIGQHADYIQAQVDVENGRMTP
jgi:dTDP-glucose pyrophosphorylase